MNRIRMVALAALTVCAVSLGAAGTASAQDAPAVPATKKVALTGTNKGKDFKGTYTIQRFETRSGKLYAVGTVTGTLKNRKVSRSNVAIPAALTGDDAASAAQAAACDILHLTLGPLDLNLLGLRVQLNRVKLDITAVPGDGNLLGNLLCSLTGILNQGGLLTQLQNLVGGLNQVADALNAILALLPTNPATGATAVAGR
jgi:hypothetical protein